jgi:3-hydroxyisobutyrate dehydrogenase-like beta-hydroxyacid dehydrogenase
MSKPRIGFVGVGLMGHGMAKNLLEKGWPLAVVAHRNRQPVDDLVARGAQEAPSLAALIEGAEVLVLCVTSSREVEAIVEGPGGVLEAGRRGLVVLDCSTSHPDSTLRLGAKLDAAGIRLVDAPLARTPKEAAEGRLLCFVGAEPALLEEVRPIAEAWSEKVIHAGPLGAGHRVKLINNFVAMSYAMVYAEAYAACRKSGVDGRVFDQVISSGGLNCANYQNFRRYVVEGDRKAHPFALRNCAKDMRYYTQMLDAVGGVTPVGDLALRSYQQAVNGGRAEQYIPQLADLFAEMNGLQPGPLTEVS